MATMNCPDCGAGLDAVSVDQPCPGCGGHRREGRVNVGAFADALTELGTLPADRVRQVHVHDAWALVEMTGGTGASSDRHGTTGNVLQQALVTSFCGSSPAHRETEMPDGTAELELGQKERAAAWARAIMRLRECRNAYDEWVRDYLVHEATWYAPLATKQPAAHKFRYVSVGVLPLPRGTKDFEREHVKPRARAEAEVRAAATEDAIARILGELKVCAVTRAEHALLPENLDGWDRYREAGVRVWDCRDKQWVL